MSFGEEVNAAKPGTGRPTPKLVPTLGEVALGTDAQLEFGGVWVRVYSRPKSKLYTHCRVISDDGTESEPHLVPSSWRVVNVRVKGGSE